MAILFDDLSKAKFLASQVPNNHMEVRKIALRVLNDVIWHYMIQRVRMRVMGACLILLAKYSWSV
jgi:hypothetical protein